MAHGGMRPLAFAPLAAPLPRQSGAEAFWNSRGRDRVIAVPWSVPAFLLRMPGGASPLRRTFAPDHMPPAPILPQFKILVSEPNPLVDFHRRLAYASGR